MTREAPHRNRRFRGAALLVAVALAWSAAPAGAFETQLWSINVTSVPAKSEPSDRLKNFDAGRSLAYASLSGMSQRTTGAVGLSKADDTVVTIGKKVGSYFIGTTDKVVVSIECKGPIATYSADLKGVSSATSQFKDGFTTLVDSFIGSGFAKVGVSGTATGDLTYNDKPFEPLALASGDDKEAVEAELELLGQKIKVKPTEAEDAFTKGETGHGEVPKTAPVTKKVFRFTLINGIRSEIKTDNSTIGSALAGTKGHVLQEAKVEGNECQVGDLSSTLTLDLRVKEPNADDAKLDATARIAVETRQAGTPPTTVESIDRTFSIFEQANYRRVKSDSDEKVFEEDGWDKGAGGITLVRGDDPMGVTTLGGGSWRPSRVVGAPLGTALTYRIKAPDESPLGVVDELELEVHRIDQRSGDVIFEARARGGKKTSGRFKLPANVERVRDGIWGVVVPSNLEVGDRVLRIGEVVAAADDEAVVRYKGMGAKATGTYDRDAGVLRRIVVRANGERFVMNLTAVR